MSLQVCFLHSDVMLFSSWQQLAGVFIRMVFNPERNWEHRLPVMWVFSLLAVLFCYTDFTVFLLLKLLRIF